jgi:pyrroline-5-carboxylate reductase
MSDISMIGLGAMGSALARAENLADALAANPITVVCIDSYATTETLLAEHRADA